MGFFFTRDRPIPTDCIEYDRGDGGIGIIDEYDTAWTDAPIQLEEFHHDSSECFGEEAPPSIIAVRGSNQCSTNPCDRVIQPGDYNYSPPATSRARNITIANFLPIVNTNSFTRFTGGTSNESVNSQGNTTIQPPAELDSESEEFAYTGPEVERCAHGSARCTTPVAHNEQETDLSQSDMSALDNLFSTLPRQGSPSHSRSSLEMALPGCSFGRDTRLSPHNPPSGNDAPVHIAMFHSFETFAAIGQMQMEQSLVTTAEQTDEHPNAPNVTVGPGIMTHMGLGLYVTIPSILGWLWCLWIALAHPFNKFTEMGKPTAYVTASETDRMVTINRNLLEAAPEEKIHFGVSSRTTHDIASNEAPFIDTRDDDVPTCHPFAEFTNLELPSIVSHDAVAVYVQQMQRNPTDNESLTTPRAIVAVPLNLALMIALTIIYVLIPRKCSKTERDFWRLSIQELQREFKKRGLPPNGSIRQDLIRHLCEHDGIRHSFAQRKLDKYNTLNKLELQRALKNLGANISGKKADLQYRLVLAREAFYTALSDDELQRIARHCDPMENPQCYNMELARRLAEAGPQIPLRSGD